MAVSKEVFDQTVNEVLAQNKYFYLNNQLGEMAETFLEKLKRWIDELLSSRISDEQTVEKLSDIACTVIEVLVIVCIALLLMLVIRSIYRSRKNRKIDEILGEKITKETTPFTLLDKARRFETKEEYRMSIRYSYIGLLLLMHEKKLLYIEKSMTNTEIYNALRDNTFGRLTQMKQLMKHFEYTWYGQNAYSQEEYMQYQIEHKALWDEVMKNEKGLKK